METPRPEIAGKLTYPGGASVAATPGRQTRSRSGVPHDIQAVFLDIGGVMLVPDVRVLSDEFADADLQLTQDDFWRAHYFGVAALDEFGVKPGAWAEGYVEGVLDGLCVTGQRRDRLRSVLMGARRMSDAKLWRWPVPGSFEALGELSDRRQLAGPAVKLAFVSNSDGSAEQKLVSMRLSQVGPGDGVEVDAILDSAVVGVAKPDPAIFEMAAAALGVDGSRSVFVGDSRFYDVDGARGAGLIPLHFDPFALCDRDDHGHLAGLANLLDMV
jgi:putative hydrolase of the HAD superfamily